MVDNKSFKNRLYEIIFEADTKAGKAFDIILLILISVSIITVSLESVKIISFKYGNFLYAFEWIITFFFTLEYILRVFIVKNPKSYIFSFFGIIDFLSILLSYISIFIVGAHGLVVIRALRLLRVFRVFKLSRYVSESMELLLCLQELLVLNLLLLLKKSQLKFARTV
ncbi:MAG: ion transporter [Bacteroidales bacterium]|nr:ion transporter [Bacteroidales bacterium]MBN2756373.1 ion transporter [Bacteroidales bacterium]